MKFKKTCDNCLKRTKKVCRNKKKVCKNWTPKDLDKYLKVVACKEDD